MSRGTKLLQKLTNSYYMKFYLYKNDRKTYAKELTLITQQINFTESYASDSIEYNVTIRDDGSAEQEAILKYGNYFHLKIKQIIGSESPDSNSHKVIIDKELVLVKIDRNKKHITTTSESYFVLTFVDSWYFDFLKSPYVYAGVNKSTNQTATLSYLISLAGSRLKISNKLFISRNLDYNITNMFVWGNFIEYMRGLCTKIPVYFYVDRNGIFVRTNDDIDEKNYIEMTYLSPEAEISMFPTITYNHFTEIKELNPLNLLNDMFYNKRRFDKLYYGYGRENNFTAFKSVEDEVLKDGRSYFNQAALNGAISQNFSTVTNENNPDLDSSYNTVKKSVTYFWDYEFNMFSPNASISLFDVIKAKAPNAYTADRKNNDTTLETKDIIGFVMNINHEYKFTPSSSAYMAYENEVTLLTDAYPKEIVAPDSN